MCVTEIAFECVCHTLMQFLVARIATLFLAHSLSFHRLFLGPLVLGVKGYILNNLTLTLPTHHLVRNSRVLYMQHNQ